QQRLSSMHTSTICHGPFRGVPSYRSQHSSLVALYDTRFVIRTRSQTGRALYTEIGRPLSHGFEPNRPSTSSVMDELLRSHPIALMVLWWPVVSAMLSLLAESARARTRPSR